jgi:hypothetical protein
MASKLEFIKSITVPNNVASTVSATDIFTSDYDTYKIVSTAHIHNADKDIYIRYINSSGSIVSDSDYDVATLMMRTSDGFLDRPTSRQNIDTGSYFCLTAGNNGCGAIEYVFNPTNTSSYTFGLNQSMGFYVGSQGYGTKTIRVLKQTTSITGIQLYNGESSDNFGGGTINVYGVK